MPAEKKPKASKPSKEYYQGETFTNLDPEKLNNAEFNDCIFKNCRWIGVRIASCSFLGCGFERCVLSGVTFSFSMMREAYIENCSFRSVAWGGLQGRGMVSLPFTRLKNCALQYNTFGGMTLGGFDFTTNSFDECTFDDCRLARADFNGVPLKHTAFTRCNLQGVDFRGATDYAIDLDTNELKDARFSFPDVVALLNGTGIKIE